MHSVDTSIVCEHIPHGPEGYCCAIRTACNIVFYDLGA